MTTAHEPRREPGVHLSAEDLSAVAEGAQPAAEGASEHLLGCAECRADADAITRLVAALAAMDRPSIPQHVGIRIDAALAREARARALAHTAASGAPSSSSAESGPAAAARSTRGGAPGQRRRWRPSRGLGWGLASLAVLAGGLTLAVNLVSSNTTTAESSSGSAAMSPYASANRGPQQAPDRLSAPTEVPATSPLAMWVKQTLTGEKPDTRINSPCLADPAFTGESPLHVVNGTYEGVPATLVIYPNGNEPATVRAVVYAQPCATLHFRVLSQGIVAK